MSNITARNLKRLQRLVGFPIVGYTTDTDSSFTKLVYVDNDGVEQTTQYPKQSILDGFKLVGARVGVTKDPLTYNQVYQMFSDKYGLGLVEGVDYTSNDQIVVIPEDGKTTITLQISDNSYLYLDSLPITVYILTVEKMAKSLGKIGDGLRLYFAQTILSVSRPFDPEAQAFVGNQLTGDTVEVIKTALKDNTYFTDEIFEHLATASIVNYQTYQKVSGERVVRCYLKDTVNRIWSLGVIPNSDADRPTKK